MSVARPLLVLAVLTGCGAPLPAPADLYGTWAETDAGEVRAWVFAASLDDGDLAGLDDVYELYLYPEGEPPVAVQRGTYTTDYAPLNSADQRERPALIQEVVWSADSALVGSTFGNEILGWTSTSLTLDSASAAHGERTFTKVDALP